MAETVIGVFKDMAAAERVVADIESSGFSRGDISVVASDRRQVGAAPGIGPVEGISTGVGAGAGAAIGGAAGALIAGLAALAIPGVGPLLASGPLASALAGLGAGAAAGGAIGGLVSWGVSEKEAAAYTEAVKGGGVLVAVHAPPGKSGAAIDIMNRDGAIDLVDQTQPWRRTDTRRDDDADLVARVEDQSEAQTGRERAGGAGARVFTW